ncbi:gp214 [Bacillus phage G]|uniref:Gp214 n=1 Tax=Bacillus phage G TaxID=2884420 RepID=G3MBT0_9CAUD|nr:gp214 [Bacillus phage G]AEO93473.1 gp214 [Bacillus phage G]
MRNLKFKKTLSLFIWSFIILFFFSTTFTWINFYQFKSNSDKHQEEMSYLIASDIKNRYESISSFIETMEPYISETVEKSLYSIEREINANNMQLDNNVLKSLKKEYNLTNIYVLDKNGIVQYSTDEKEIGKLAREFYKKEDKQRWETAFKKIVETKEVYIEDKFYRSEIYPHRYHKWGYKGIGYIDNVGLVVLEVGLQVLDIKDDSITPLVNQVVELKNINKNIVSLDFINLPPTKLTKNYKEEQIKNKDGSITTKINIKGLDNATVQAKVVSRFDSTLDSVQDAFVNAIIWTFFYAIFSFTLCLLLYYRFTIPIKIINENIIKDSINELNELKKDLLDLKNNKLK